MYWEITVDVAATSIGLWGLVWFLSECHGRRYTPVVIALLCFAIGWLLHAALVWGYPPC